MARQCDVCAKTASFGNSIEIRGKAKYLGGVGTKVTGITRRKFRPNLQSVKVQLPSGEHKSLRVLRSMHSQWLHSQDRQAKTVRVARQELA